MDTGAAHNGRKNQILTDVNSATAIIRHSRTLCFEQCNPLGPGQDDVPALLRRVADTIEELGDIEICDLILHPRTTAPIGQDWPSIVVYYHYRIIDEQRPRPAP